MSSDQATVLAAALAQAGAAGLRRVSDTALPQIARAAAQLGLRYAEVDLGGCPGAASALAAIARTLAFPDWFGGNFDALNDCLGDFAADSGAVVVVRQLATLAAADPAAAATLLAVVAAVGEARRDGPAPLWLFVASADAAASRADLPWRDFP